MVLSCSPTWLELEREMIDERHSAMVKPTRQFWREYELFRTQRLYSIYSVIIESNDCSYSQDLRQAYLTNCCFQRLGSLTLREFSESITLRRDNHSKLVIAQAVGAQSREPPSMYSCCTTGSKDFPSFLGHFSSNW